MSTKKKGHAILLGRTEETSTWEAILRATQPELKTCLHRWLEQNGFTPVSRDGYLYAAGGVPVLLVAHLDTVHREPVLDICYNADRTVAMSPQGIGGDDRAGVWMALHSRRYESICLAVAGSLQQAPHPFAAGSSA